MEEGDCEDPTRSAALLHHYSNDTALLWASLSLPPLCAGRERKSQGAAANEDQRERHRRYFRNVRSQKSQFLARERQSPRKSPPGLNLISHCVCYG